MLRCCMTKASRSCRDFVNCVMDWVENPSPSPVVEVGDDVVVTDVDFDDSDEDADLLQMGDAGPYPDDATFMS